MQKNSKSPNIDPCGTSQSILAVLAYLFFKNACFKDEIETTLLIDSKILEKLNLVRKLRIARFMLSKTFCKLMRKIPVSRPGSGPKLVNILYVRYEIEVSAELFLRN